MLDASYIYIFYILYIPYIYPQPLKLINFVSSSSVMNIFSFKMTARKYVDFQASR